MHHTNQLKQFHHTNWLIKIAHLCISTLTSDKEHQENIKSFKNQNQIIKIISLADSCFPLFFRTANEFYYEKEKNKPI